MPWATRTSKRIPSIGSRTSSYEINDYSRGMNSYTGNDKFPLKDGEANMFRLSQNARIPTLGEYETRKGFDLHSVPAGQTKDDNEESVVGAADQTFNNVTRIAQKFTTTVAGAFTRADVRLKNSASATGNIIVELWSNSGGAPSAMLAESSIVASDVTSSYTYLPVYFAAAPTLTVATSYWIVVYSAATGTGSYFWSSTTTNTDALGSINSGSTWSAKTYAVNFKQYYSTTGGSKGLHRTYKSDGTKVTLLAHGTSLYTVDNVTGALTAIKTGLSASATTYRFVTVNDIVYYVNGFNGLRKWNFTTESQVNATNYTHIAIHKGLLFLVRKDDPTKVEFSNFGVYETFTSTDFVYVPAPKTGDPITATNPLNGYLIISTQNSKYILSGDDNATFSLNAAPDQKGTYSQETTYVDKNYMYFLSDDGVYRSNGSEAQLISENVYQEIHDLLDKDECTLCVNKGRVYLWYKAAGSSYENECFVWNISLSSQTDTVESKDTAAYVSRAVSAPGDDNEMMVASSVVGQVFWQERDSNDHNNLGGAIDFKLRSHYMTFGVPASLKEVRYWEPRFGAQAANYSVSCQYATDLRDNFQTQSLLAVQGAGYTWGNAATIWGSFTWGTTAEVQAYLYIPGEYRRVAIQYSHNAAREPHKFLGHSINVQTRRMR